MRYFSENHCPDMQPKQMASQTHHKPRLLVYCLMEQSMPRVNGIPHASTLFANQGSEMYNLATAAR